MRKFNYLINNDSATSCEVFISDKGTVTKIYDTSTALSQSEGWRFPLKSLIGKSFAEVDKIILSDPNNRSSSSVLPKRAISRIEDKNPIMAALHRSIKNWSVDGYDSFAKKLEPYIQYASHCSWASSFEYNISNIEIVSGLTKSLSGDVQLTNDLDSPITIQKQYIIDRLTGNSSLLNQKIDLRSLSGSQVQNLLNNKEVGHFDKNGNFLGKLSLVKTTGGFALSIGKETISIADSGSGI